MFFFWLSWDYRLPHFPFFLSSCLSFLFQNLKKNIFPPYFRHALFFPSFHFLFFFPFLYSSFPLLIRCFFFGPYFLILLFLFFVFPYLFQFVLMYFLLFFYPFLGFVRGIEWIIVNKYMQAWKKKFFQNHPYIFYWVSWSL